MPEVDPRKLELVETDPKTNILVVIALGLGLYLVSFYNYLLFHSLVELFSIIIACGIFMFAWNSSRFLDNNYFLFLGLAYLFISGIDAVHIFSYKGMGVFKEQNANLPTQLWIAARYLQGFSLLIATWLMGRKLNIRAVLTSFTIILFILFASIFTWHIFPDCYIEGVGLTPFKKISEYIISGILLAAAIFLVKKRKHFNDVVLKLLVASIILTIFAELAFTEYISVYGFANMLGHFLKVAAFYILYKATIEMELKKPYNVMFRGLKRSTEQLWREKDFSERLIDNSSEGIIAFDRNFNCTVCNLAMERISGQNKTWALGKQVLEVFPFLRENEQDKALSDILEGKSIQVKSRDYIMAGSQDRGVFEAQYSPLSNIAGEVIGGLAFIRDITARKKAEEEIARLATFPELNPNPVVEMDLSGNISYLNPVAGRLFELDGFQELFISDISSLKKIFEEGGSDTFYREINFGPAWFQQNFHYIPKTQRVRVYSLDITERKRAEAVLFRSHTELEAEVSLRTAELLELNRQLKQEIKERKDAERLTQASNSILKVLSGAVSRKDFLHKVMEIIRDIAGCRCTGIRIVTENEEMPYEAYTGFSQEFWQKDNWLSLKNDQCICIRVVAGAIEPQLEHCSCTGL